MKVSSYTPSDIPGSKTPATNTPKTEPTLAQSAKAVASEPGVAVVITSAARNLSKPAASQAADVDTAKVAAVKASIQDGSFRVNPEAIADKLLSNTQEMFNKPL
jgi:negative regulator of flagellin synthesis FlgM